MAKSGRKELENVCFRQVFVVALEKKCPFPDQNANTVGGVMNLRSICKIMSKNLESYLGLGSHRPIKWDNNVRSKRGD